MGLKKSNPPQPTWIGLDRVEPMGWLAFYLFILIFLLNWAEKKNYLTYHLS